MPPLHWRLVRRLFAGFVVLSLLIGGGVFFNDLEDIDQRVVALGEHATAEFLADNRDALLHSAAPATRASLARATEALLQDHFVIVELYDAGRNPLVERGRPGYDKVEAELNRSPHRFPLQSQPTYERHLVDGVIYLQVLTPIADAGEHTVAYFEGVYEVDAETMQAIRDGILHSLSIVVIAVLATTVLLYPAIIALNRDLQRHADRLLRANLETLEVLGNAIAKRDSDTDTHNYRVTWYAIRLGEAAGLDTATMRRLIKGAFLHDVGKIGITDSILLKPGRLTPEEFTVMKTHVTIGLDIIASSEWLAEAADVVRYHHEKVDGSGYMDGLTESDIPVAARIFAIVDVFDALTSRRPYKEPMPLAQALSILDDGDGRHFDSRLLALFRPMAARLLEAAGDMGDSGMRAALHRDTERYFFV